MRFTNNKHLRLFKTKPTTFGIIILSHLDLEKTWLLVDLRFFVVASSSLVLGRTKREQGECPLSEQDLFADCLFGYNWLEFGFCYCWSTCPITLFPFWNGPSKANNLRIVPNPSRGIEYSSTAKMPNKSSWAERWERGHGNKHNTCLLFINSKNGTLGQNKIVIDSHISVGSRFFIIIKSIDLHRQRQTDRQSASHRPTDRPTESGKRKNVDRIYIWADTKEAFWCNILPCSPASIAVWTELQSNRPSAGTEEEDCQLKFVKGWSPMMMMCNQWPITLSFKHVDIEWGKHQAVSAIENENDWLTVGRPRCLLPPHRKYTTPLVALFWTSSLLAGQRKWRGEQWHDMQRKGFRD